MIQRRNGSHGQQRRSAITTAGLIETYQYIFELAQEMLLDEILSFKDVAFKEEEEWRLIARPRLFTLQGRDDRGKTPTKRYFRAQRGVVVPFLKLISLKGNFLWPLHVTDQVIKECQQYLWIISIP
jgi:hypothetical protein